MIIENILRTLATRFDSVVIAIEEAKDLDQLKLDELQGSIEAHEQRFIERMVDRHSQHALTAQFKKRIIGHLDKLKKDDKKSEGDPSTKRHISSSSFATTSKNYGKNRYANCRFCNALNLSLQNYSISPESLA
ncbi:hypothetical protein Lal_00024277 [Lupinus albus]|nr:hypothetical protein Lal_00024277 [Lupinus albus]